MPQANSKSLLIHLTHLIIHCIQLSQFPTSWREAKAIVLPKLGKDPTFTKHLSPKGQFFQEVILKITQRTLFFSIKNFSLLKSWVTQNFITIKTSWNTND
jgi:hypothetical protein